MARNELRRRVDALEATECGFVGPAVWLVLNDGETAEQGLERWEAENGPRLPGQPSIIWHRVHTGVPRGPDSVVHS